MSYDGLPATYQPSRQRVLAGCTAVLVFMYATWTAFDQAMHLEVELLGIGGPSRNTLTLTLSCSQNVVPLLNETDEIVRVGHIGGQVIDGDCLGSATVRLSRSLGQRRLFVDAEEWTPAGRGCYGGDWGPLDPRRRCPETD